jgi:hypothetical protein
MNKYCKKCGRIIRHRINYPHGRKSSSRVTYFCKYCDRSAR